jgi:hypothetical protein
MVLSIDQPASSALTRELLRWRPVQPGLIEGLDVMRHLNVSGHASWDCQCSARTPTA